LASSTVSGGLGSDRLVLTAGGTAQTSHVSGVETFQLADSAAARIALADGNFTGITGTAITVIAGAAGDTVDASAVSAAHRVVFVGGAGKDVFTGGAGADTFEFAAAAVGGIDRLRGAGGNDRLVLKSSGTIANAGVFTGIETIVLASTGKNRLALTDSNFAGVTGKTITVTGGNAGNTIDASALSAANRVILVGGKGGDTLKGGAGADRLTAFGHATLSGEGGADLFAFEIPGTTADPDTNRVTDFSRAQGDALAFSDAGFHLGLPNASATPKALPAALFSPKIDGSFDKPGERFAYDTSTGRLYFDADGNSSSDHRQLIATFANHPASLAGALLFVS
jgi:Ca2+-binding RTX toxin-like protein